MAENKYFGSGGIIVANNFDISVQKPIDSRTTVANETGLQELKNEGRVYEGLVAFNQATQKYHKFINGDWELLITEVDTQLSTSSTNPVQNKIITEFLNNLVSFDDQDNALVITLPTSDIGDSNN